MTAPETLVVVWTFADEDTTPATVLAHTPKSRDFQSGAPKWMDGERMVYVRRDPAVLTRDETVLAMVGAAYSRAADEAEEHKHFANGMNCVKTCINLLTPADAAAALAARDKRIRDEALADAAKFCRLRIMQNSPATDQDQAVAIDEAEVIEAAILRMKGAKP